MALIENLTCPKCLQRFPVAGIALTGACPCCGGKTESPGWFLGEPTAAQKDERLV